MTSNPERGGKHFQLRRLIVQSSTKRAEVEFRSGMNVIAGPSDTGKTYIFQCLRFALGGKEVPKPIPEAQGYERLFLVICANDGTSYTIERSLSGGDIALSEGDAAVPETLKNKKTLPAEHSGKNPRTLSSFLLNLSGLENKLVMTKKSNTMSLSFRDVRQLVMVDEERIVKEGSPILSQNFAANTREKSVFNLLITGVDDSSVLIANNVEQKQENTNSEIEKLDFLLSEFRKDLPQDFSAEEIGASIERLEKTLDNVGQAHDVRQRELQTVESFSQELQAEKRRVLGRIDALTQLLARFLLLHEKYINDIDRLGALDQASDAFSQYDLVACPICGSSLKGSESHFHNVESNFADIAKGIEAEREKLVVLIGDLNSTVDRLTVEKLDLEESRTQIESRLDGLERTRKEVLGSTSFETALDVKNLTLTLIERRQQLLLGERIQQILSQRASLLETPAPPVEVEIQRNDALAKEELSLEIEGILKSWKYPALTRVTFDNSSYDLIISGQSRKAHGKGYRALTHAAFSIGLMNYCFSKHLHHPGFVVLDSPLTTYKGKDATSQEDVSADMKSTFYVALAKASPETQIIIIDNDEPPDMAQRSINYVHFTKEPHSGRAGFFTIN